MLVERTTFLPCPPDRCLAEVKTSRLLSYVAHPLVHFVAINPDHLPEQWDKKSYLVRLRLFGFVPFGLQHIDISWRDLSVEKGAFCVQLRDNGRGTLISQWDHFITISQTQGGCHYTDRVEVKAGLFTLFVWAFAWLFYRHRQRRLLSLAARDFAYE